MYTHDGQTVVDTDGFSVTLSDGRFNVTSHIEVIIGLVNDETPRMAVNRGLRVKSGPYLSMAPVYVKQKLNKKISR